MRSYKADLSRRLGPVFAEQAAQPKTTSTRNLPAESFFTVVYKLTDANIAKYLSNRDWVTYVYADSMAELRRQHTENETLRAIAAAYKPTHGGYPSAGAQA